MLFALFLLAGCRQPEHGYVPVEPASIVDNWRVTVASTGQVNLTRHIVLDNILSPYLRGSSRLDGASLIGSLPTEEYNECSLIQGRQQVEYSCRVAYTIQIVPTEPEAELPLPGDRLLRFITDMMGYQPVPIEVSRKVVVSVPGRVMAPDADTISYFPVYSWQAFNLEQPRDSQLALETRIILAPGDLPNPRLRRLPSVSFEPIMGFR